jgi:hypothetical protein
MPTDRRAFAPGGCWFFPINVCVSTRTVIGYAVKILCRGK